MKRPNSTKLSIESLERREMMAASATLANGALQVKGTDSADHIVVSQNMLTQKINVTIENIATGNLVLQRSFKASSVNSIKVECFGGDDVAENNTTKPSHMYGGAGGDTLAGGSADDVFYSGLVFGGTDTGVNILNGNGGNDTLMGGSAVDFINGGAGDDYVYGAGGDDILSGGANIDYLFGDGGSDHLFGGTENDYLYGGLGADTLDGEDGDDYLYAKDEFFGADSDLNILYGGSGRDKIFGAAGIDVCYGGVGDDDIFGGKGDDSLHGEGGNDLIFGEDGNDTLWGYEGNDELHGGNGDDYCMGNDGDDFVAGGNGIDSLFGDDGEDELIFDALDFTVDGILGAARWPWAPKLTSGPYNGHGVHNG